jgi:hypothetical protein
MNRSFILSTSVKRMISGDEIKIFPNPANDYLQITTDVSEPDYLIELFDIPGKKVYSDRQNAKIISLDLKTIAPGIYIIKLTGRYHIITRKIIKN